MKPFLIAILFAAVHASATTITVNASNSGFYNNSGNSVGGNYTVGWFAGPGGGEARNFFVFDLSGLSGTISNATLRLTPSGSSGSGYLSFDASETFSLFDVSTLVSNLINATGGVAAFNDLGSGTQYGSSVIANPGNTPDPLFYDIPFNIAGLAFLQGNLGNNPIALGGAITTLTQGATQEALFNLTNSGLTRQLIFTIADENPGGAAVPEPATLLLSGLALIALTTAKRKKS